MDELDLFTEALNRTNPAERAAFLDHACAGNAELRERLEALLAGHNQGESPLDRPVVLQEDLTESSNPATALLTGEHPPEIAQATIDRADTDATLTATKVPTGRVARDSTAQALGSLISDRYALVELIGQGAWARSIVPARPIPSSERSLSS